MDVVVKHFGSIKDGALYLQDVPTYKANLQALDGKEIELVIQERFEDTSLQEHRYYRGIIIPTILKNESFGGWEKDYLHAYLADRFLGETRVKMINGIQVEARYVPSTANIGKRKMARFIDDVLNFLATIGIEVLPPDNYVLPKYKQ